MTPHEFFYFWIGLMLGFALMGMLAGLVIIWADKPKRNCELGTVDEQLERHRLYCIGLCTVHECGYGLDKHDMETCKKCFAKWAQMRRSK